MEIHNYAENCQFIEKQIVEKIETKEMHVQQQTLAGGDNTAGQTSSESDTPTDTQTAMFVKDRATRLQLLSAVGNCKKNSQTAAITIQLLKEANCWSNSLIGIPFSAALLPFLPYETTARALYQAFMRVI